MNKFCIFVLLFIVAFCGDDDDNSWQKEYLYDGKEADLCEEVKKTKVPSVDNCTSIEISNKDYKCCYIFFKDGDYEEKECAAMKKSKVKDFIKKYEQKNEGEKISIDCSSNYLSKALIILLSILF